MAEAIAVALISSTATLAYNGYKALSAFPDDHDHIHDEEAKKTRKLIGDFEKLRQAGQMADKYDKAYLQTKVAANQLNNEYEDSISAFREISPVHLLKIWKQIKKVKNTEQRVKQKNRELQRLHDKQTSASSDASSTDEEYEVAEQNHHPVQINDALSKGRYSIVKSLGHDRSSTLWLAKDHEMDRYVSLRVVKSGGDYKASAVNRVDLLRELATSCTSPIAPSASNPTSSAYPGRSHIALLLDDFRHGPNGEHVCIVSEMLNINLLGLIIQFKNDGIPVHFVKQIAKQMLLGLDCLHTHFGVIHTDLRPENILISVNATAPLSTEKTTGEKITVKIAALENATWTRHHDLPEHIQTRQYRCPEVILGAKWGPSSDIWSVACILFEVITGDYLFDPPAGSQYTKDDDHIAQIIGLLGEIPKNVALSGKYSNDFFDSEGEFRHIRNVGYCPLETVLHGKYRVSKPDADALAAFLVPMLHPDPDKRPKISELVQHNWLVSRGGIDVVRQMEGTTAHVRAANASLPRSPTLTTHRNPKDSLHPSSPGPAPLSGPSTSFSNSSSRPHSHTSVSPALTSASPRGKKDTMSTRKADKTLTGEEAKTSSQKAGKAKDGKEVATSSTPKANKTLTGKEVETSTPKADRAPAEEGGTTSNRQENKTLTRKEAKISNQKAGKAEAGQGVATSSTPKTEKALAEKEGASTSNREQNETLARKKTKTSNRKADGAKAGNEVATSSTLKVNKTLAGREEVKMSTRKPDNASAEEGATSSTRKENETLAGEKAKTSNKKSGKAKVGKEGGTSSTEKTLTGKEEVETSTRKTDNASAEKEATSSTRKENETSVGEKAKTSNQKSGKAKAGKEGATSSTQKTLTGKEEVETSTQKTDSASAGKEEAKTLTRKADKALAEKEAATSSIREAAKVSAEKEAATSTRKANKPLAGKEEVETSTRKADNAEAEKEEARTSTRKADKAEAEKEGRTSSTRNENETLDGKEEAKTPTRKAEKTSSGKDAKTSTRKEGKTSAGKEATWSTRKEDKTSAGKEATSSTRK